GEGDPPLSACRHRRSGAIRMSPCRLRFTRPHPSGLWPYHCVCRVATSASAFLPVVEKRGRETPYSTSCIATGCAVPSL
ncbi:hypothetical protein FAN16_27190, partial [Klebsiella pneumoniae subsp. pneumoniae]